MNAYSVVYAYNGILFSQKRKRETDRGEGRKKGKKKKKENLAICHNTDRPRGYYANRNKSDKEDKCHLISLIYRIKKIKKHLTWEFRLWLSGNKPD